MHSLRSAQHRVRALLSTLSVRTQKNALRIPESLKVLSRATGGPSQLLDYTVFREEPLVPTVLNLQLQCERATLP